MKSDGVATSLAPSCSLVLLYFSAHWCPPCRQFTPVLRDFHAEAVEQDLGIEVVFVSWDRSEREMYDYMKSEHGSWPALGHGEQEGKRLQQEHGVEGIPALVVVRRDGTLVTKTGREDVVGLGPARAVARWRAVA